MSEPTPKEPRGPTNLRIKFRSASLDQFIERYAADVSRGGIFIRTREPLAVNTRLRLDFQLQDGALLLAGEGTVVWIREHDQARENATPGMGVRFDKLTPECQPTLEKILTEKTRLEQAGVSGAGQAKSGGIAVRRPSGVFASLDAGARAALGGTPPIPGTPEAAGPEAAPGATAPAPAAAPTSRTTGFLASRAGVPGAPASAAPSGPFSRARATGTRPVPVPSALFEPPTAADIDKALEALQEAPGPAPAARQSPAAPRYVADDASNEPTRVADVVEELVGAGPRAGAAPPSDHLATGGADQAGDTDEQPAAVMAAAAEASVAALDGPMEIKDVEVQPAVPEPQAEVQAPVPLEASKRFRAASRAYPTLQGRRRGLTGFLVVLVVLAGGAAAAIKLHLKDRLFPPAAPAPTVAAPAAALAPAAPAAAANLPPANTPPAAPEGAAGAGAVAAAPPSPPATVPAPEKAAPEKPAADKPTAAAVEEKKPEPAATAATEEHAGKRRGPRHRAEAEEKPTAAPPIATADQPAADKPAAAAPAAAAPAADKPAADQPAPDRPAETAAGDKPTTTAPAPPPPVVKITSTPSGALILIDGKEVGTTPFLSKEIDPASPHAITIKKDGYEPAERMVSGLDWSRPKGNNPQTLKVNAKLRRSTPAAPAATGAAPAAPKDTGDQKGNAEPEDTGGPYIKEVKPDSP